MVVSSPFDRVLRTNYAPSAEELGAIRKLVLSPEEQVQLLNEKIFQLEAERDKLQSFINDHRALLSPARRLPRDIIAEIFLHCLPTDQLPTCDASKMPLVLTTVCRSWREIAVTTPRLWRAIHFVIPALVGYTIEDDFRTLFHLRKEGLQLWLERAKSVPLIVSCYMQFNSKKPREVGNELQTMYTEYMKVLSRYSTQWKTLYLSSIPLELLSPLQVLKANDVPLLRTLSLESNAFELGRPWMLASREHPLLDITRTPSLRALHLSREPADIFLFPARWADLTELSICPLSRSFPQSAIDPLQVVQRLAQTCHSLRKCNLDLTMSRFDEMVNVHSSRQTWQHLTDLRISLGIDVPDGIAQSHRVIQGIFDSILTPALSHLAVLIPTRDVVTDRAPFLELLQVSDCNIASLELNMQLSSSALIGCLQSIPSLTTLRLTDALELPSYVSEEGVIVRPPSYPILTSDVFQALSDNELCPFLENVTFIQCPIESIDDIVDFGLSRATIKTLSVVFQNDMQTRHPPGLTDEEREKGELLKQRGITVEWRSVFEAETLRPFDANVFSLPTSGMPRSFNGVY
ncbi:hypothetical protein VNI00_013822 [Paramarasmius palmivorus]|uniref:F-box domain-containing protein n=1 Tax=Paramarasmius palmivorus TaxID=297713 RepID=A0AAW0BY00_9AGAR